MRMPCSDSMMIIHYSCFKCLGCVIINLNLVATDAFPARKSTVSGKLLEDTENISMEAIQLFLASIATTKPPELTTFQDMLS